MRNLIILILLTSLTLMADTPPLGQVNSKTLDGNGAKITSTAVSGKTALDVNLASGSVSAMVTSSPTDPLYVSSVFANTIIDPRSRSWALNTSDQVTAFQGSAPWSILLPNGASTSALQTTGNSYLQSLDSKVPSIGQKTASGSMAVVLASDQTPIPITGSITSTNSANGTPNAIQPSQATMVGGSDGTKLQALKVSPDGTLQTTFTNSSLPVTGSVNVNNFPSTQVITASTLPLPTGAATSSLQNNANSSLSSIDGKLSSTVANQTLQTAGNAYLNSIDSKTPVLGQQLAANSSPVVLTAAQLSTLTPLSSVSVNNFPLSQAVTGTFWQATQPISAASLPLPSGASTSALQSTANTSLASIDSKLTSPITIAGSITATNSANGNTGAAPPAQANQIAGSDGTNLRAVKVSSTGVVSVDGSATTQPISGSVSVSNFPATQPVSGTVAVSNFPSTQNVNVTNSSLTVTGPLTDSQLRASDVGVAVNNFPSGFNVNNFPSSQNVVVTSSALPTGAATSANQSTANASLSSIDNKLTAPLSTSRTWSLASSTDSTTVTGSVSITNSSLAVTGPLTDTQLRASAVPVSLASAPTTTVVQPTGTNLHTVVDSSALPTGAALESGHLASVDISTAAINTKLTTTANGLKVDGSAVTQPISASSLPLPSGAATSAYQASADTTLTSINNKLTSPITTKVEGELFNSFSPDPSNVTTNTFQPIRFDARGRIETHSTILTDEGSFRDSFSGSSLLPAWTQSGGSVSVANGSVTLRSGTAAGNANISHAADYGPFIISTKFSISQRIANQTIFVGVRDNLTSPTIRSEFNFSGTDNTQVQCITQTSSDSGNIQTTTITLPKNQTTATSLEYSIEVTSQQINFTVGGVVVCTHKDSVQDSYSNLNFGYGFNNAATVTNTNLVADWINFLNVNRVEVSNVFKGQKIEVDDVHIEDSKLLSYRAVAVGFATATTATDIFTITGSATKTIKIRKISVEATQTTGSIVNMLLVKRSTADTGGTSSTLTNVPIDSDDAAATATVRSYTANPTLGTSIGNIYVKKMVINTTTAGASAQDNDPVIVFDGNNVKPIVLRGTSEVLSVNLNSTTILGSSFDIWVEWTEEDL